MFQYNIKEVNSLKGIADKQKVEFKGVKENLEQQLKFVNIMLENHEKNLREEIVKKQGVFLEKLNFELGDVRNRFMEIKIENGKYHVETMKIGKDLKQEIEFLKVYKVQLDDQVGEFGYLHENSNNRFNKLQDEFNQFKLKFNEIAEFIKVIKIYNPYLFYLIQDVRFRKNLGDGDNKKNFIQLANKTTYDPRFQIKELKDSEVYIKTGNSNKNSEEGKTI